MGVKQNRGQINSEQKPILMLRIQVIMLKYLLEPFFKKLVCYFCINLKFTPSKPQIGLRYGEKSCLPVTGLPLLSLYLIV